MVSNQLMRMGCLNEDRWDCQQGGKAQGHAEQGKKQHQKAQDKNNCWYLEQNCEKVLEAKYHITEQVLSEHHPYSVCEMRPPPFGERRSTVTKRRPGISALISIQTSLLTLGSASSVVSCSSTL